YTKTGLPPEGETKKTRGGGKENPEVPAAKKRGGIFLKKSRHFFPPPEVYLRPFSQTISRQHLHPGKEPPAVGKACFTIESAKHSH
ncbi:hypothetical protein O1442_05305, partial [Bacteroides fragilis]|uniref:hypothetical protein n=1 Tax=Bacteroides fragilis TaxID=817 RepID=UPI0022AA72AD